MAELHAEQRTRTLSHQKPHQHGSPGRVPLPSLTSRVKKTGLFLSLSSGSGQDGQQCAGTLLEACEDPPTVWPMTPVQNVCPAGSGLIFNLYNG